MELWSERSLKVPCGVPCILAARQHEFKRDCKTVVLSVKMLHSRQ